MSEYRRSLRAWALLPCIALAGTGCASFHARRTFDQATPGKSWSAVGGTERYSRRNQFAVWSMEGPGDQEGTDYYIVVSGHGRVVAKAYSIAGRPSAVGLAIEARHWRELRDVQGHYPYRATVGTVGGIKLQKVVYPPLVRPFSTDDRVLPSGVRQSTWAWLTIYLWGWPFKTKPFLERQIRETRAYWDGTIRSWPEAVKLMEGLGSEGTVTVFWGKGPLSR